MAKGFQQPVVRLKGEITRNQERGYWEIAAAAPDGLAAVRIGESGLRKFLGMPKDEPEALTDALRANLKRFEKLAWSIEIREWANDFDISPVFTPGAGKA